MTARLVFKYMLMELSKINAPSLSLEEFNYFFNKAINQYVNKRYNIYDINLLTTDDVRVLKATAHLTPTKAYSDLDRTDDSVTAYLSSKYPQLTNLNGATYEVDLPADYLHLLNCVCIYKVTKDYECYNGGSYWPCAAKRLTADSWSTIINDYYNRPAYNNPYYYIHNVNLSNNVPTNPVVYDREGNLVSGTDMTGLYLVNDNGFVEGTSKEGYNTLNEISYGLYNGLDKSDEVNSGSNFPRIIKLGDGVSISTVLKPTAYRTLNPSKVRLEIRYGKDDSIFKLVQVDVDYIKTPQHVRLTPEQMDLVEDTSQIMEFPDVVCQEIINELTILVMARTGDPLLNSFASVTTTIANPAAQQQQPAAQAAQ